MSNIQRINDLFINNKDNIDNSNNNIDPGQTVSREDLKKFNVVNTSTTNSKPLNSADNNNVFGDFQAVDENAAKILNALGLFQEKGKDTLAGFGLDESEFGDFNMDGKFSMSGNNDNGFNINDMMDFNGIKSPEDSLFNNLNLSAKTLSLLNQSYEDMQQSAKRIDNNDTNLNISNLQADNIFRLSENRLTDLKSQSLITLNSIQAALAQSTKEHNASTLPQNLSALLEQYRPMLDDDLSDEETKDKLAKLSKEVHALVQKDLNQSSMLVSSAQTTPETSYSLQPMSYAAQSSVYNPAIPDDDITYIPVSNATQSLNQILALSNTGNVDPLYLAMMLFIVLANGQSQVCNTNMQMIQTNKASGSAINYATSAMNGITNIAGGQLTYTTSDGVKHQVTTLYGAFELAYGAKGGTAPNGLEITGMSPSQEALQYDLNPMLNLLDQVDPTGMKVPADSTGGWNAPTEADFNTAVSQMYTYVNGQITLIDPSLSQMPPLPKDSEGNYLIYAIDPTTGQPDATVNNQISTSIQTSLSSGMAAATAAGSTSSQLSLYLQANMTQYSNLMGGATNSLSMIKAIYRTIWAQ